MKTDRPLDDEVTVDRQGVRFGPYCWVSHNAITGRPPSRLAGSKVVAQQYMAWVEARLKAQEGREDG